MTDLKLQYAALSDVGRVRKDNQDSGYAGPWLLTVCDGVGGAARGDVASSTAVQQLTKLDHEPHEDLLGALAGAIVRAHDRIAELVEDDAALNGTSTTCTAGLFDGHQIGIGHVGDSRAYLLRSGELTQLTKDHTFVQSLIDEGRITEEESRTHPHKNLILKAVDSVHEAEPDLFTIELAHGDRLLFCSDGACGVLDAEKIHDILATGSPDYAAVELVRSSLEAGSTDNVTCVVADVLDPELAAAEAAETDTIAPNFPEEPMLVGAAAEIPRRRTSGAGTMGSFFKGHRSGDTGELEPVQAEIPPGAEYAIPNDPIDHLDPEAARYAPRPPSRFGWLRVLLGVATALGVVWIAGAAAWAWSQGQYYVADQNGVVTIFRGINASVPGVDVNSPYETTDVEMERLSSYDAGQVAEGIDVDDLAEAHDTVNSLAARQSATTTSEDAAPNTQSPSLGSDSTGGQLPGGSSESDSGDGGSTGGTDAPSSTGGAG